MIWSSGTRLNAFESWGYVIVILELHKTWLSTQRYLLIKHHQNISHNYTDKSHLKDPLRSRPNRMNRTAFLDRSRTAWSLEDKWPAVDWTRRMFRRHPAKPSVLPLPRKPVPLVPTTGAGLVRNTGRFLGHRWDDDSWSSFRCLVTEKHQIL